MVVHSTVLGKESRSRALASLGKYVTSDVKGRHSRLEKLCRNLAILNAPSRAVTNTDRSAIRAGSEISALAALERKRIAKAARANYPQRGPQYSLSSQAGLTVGVPPYDIGWTSGPLAGSADPKTGIFKTAALDTEGFESVAMGVNINSPVAADLRFSAECMLHRRWTDWPLDPGAVAASEGGVGVLVADPNQKFIVDQRQQLWSDSSSVPWQSHTDDDMTFLTQTTAGQVFFSVEANKNYLVWVWCWVATALSGGNGLAIASIEAQMPFVVVERQ